MRALASTLLIGVALTAGTTATYEAYAPKGAAWFQEGKMVPEQIQYSAQDESSNETGLIRKPTNHGNMEAPKYTREAYVDFKATGPPQMDNYPKSPEEAAKRSSSATATEPASHIANFGVYKD